MSSPSRLIVGLGNPGSEYAGTRHNIGFMAVDAIAERYRLPTWKRKFKSQVTSSDAQPPFLLLKPETFMNLSGEAVIEAMHFYKLAPKDILVFHDELDLPPGHVKIKEGGGAAGHNGLKSIDAHIGPDYGRVRLGIGHPRDITPGTSTSDYVLGGFSKADHTWLEPLLAALASEFDELLAGNTAAYLERVKPEHDGK